jgi:hypothetical protein
MNWRAWMTHSPDALAAEPEFSSAPTSPESAPTMGADRYGCCTTEQTFLEYTGVKFVSPTQVRGAFTRWTGKHLPELVLAKLRLPGRCLSRSRSIGLGHTRRRLLALPVKPLRRTRRSYRYCVTGRSGRVAAVFSPRGRVRLVVTTGRERSSAKRFLAAHPRARRIGPGLYRSNPRSTRLFGIRRGRVHFIAVADRRLLRPEKRLALRRYFAYSGLRR